MNRTVRLFGLVFGITLASTIFSSSLAFAQSLSGDSRLTRSLVQTSLVAATATDESSFRLPSSMLGGVSEWQAYSCPELSLAVDIDAMVIEESAAGASLANPQDASWRLGGESRARLSGLKAELQTWNQRVIGTSLIERDADSARSSAVGGKRASTTLLLSIVR